MEAHCALWQHRCGARDREVKFVKLTPTERAAKRAEEAAKKAEEAAKEEEMEQEGEP